MNKIFYATNIVIIIIIMDELEWIMKEPQVSITHLNSFNIV